MEYLLDDNQEESTDTNLLSSDSKEDITSDVIELYRITS
jgi:hypothetical protein